MLSFLVKLFFYHFNYREIMIRAFEDKFKSPHYLYIYLQSKKRPNNSTLCCTKQLFSTQTMGPIENQVEEGQNC